MMPQPHIIRDLTDKAFDDCKAALERTCSLCPIATYNITTGVIVSLFVGLYTQLSPDEQKKLLAFIATTIKLSKDTP